jgi:hypothetical protein
VTSGLYPDIGALAGSSGGIYNRIGRGIPDVSAVGDNIAVSSSNADKSHFTDLVT